MKVGLFIFGIILIAIGFVLSSYLASISAECSSLKGKAISFLDSDKAAQCSAVDSFLFLGWGIAGLGGLLFLLGLILPSGEKQQIIIQNYDSSRKEKKYAKVIEEDEEEEDYRYTCPSCEEEFDLENEEIKKLKKKGSINLKCPHCNKTVSCEK